MSHDPPPAAATVFGDALPLARRYVAALATSGVERGLIGPRETGRLWERHVLNCAVLAELVPAGSRVIDVGSGAGLPGIPLALARPDLEVVLVEPLLRRSTWLDEVIDDLWGSGEEARVRVVRARAEEMAGRMAAPVVTARAVAALDRLARWCLPLVEAGGELLALKGRTAAHEVEEHRAALRRAGGTGVQVVECGVGVLPEVTTVVRVRVGAGARRSQSGGTRRS